jgi:hypothetical protein
MQQHGSSHIQTIFVFLNMVFQRHRHTVEVCPKPAQPATITTSSPHILPTCSSFRAEFVEKLVDKPVGFRFHEAQRGSNLHSTPGDGIRP